MRESEKSGNLDDTTDLSHCYGSLGDSPHPLPHNLCFFGMGTASAEVQNQLTCMLSALTPGERPLSEAGLEDWWWARGSRPASAELPCQAQAVAKLLTLGLMPYNCRWLLASAIALWHLHSSLRQKLMGLVRPGLSFPEVIMNISALMSKPLSTERIKIVGQDTLSIWIKLIWSQKGF